jgi:hypothetical protein
VGGAGRRRERASPVEPRRRRRHGARDPDRELGDARAGLGELAIFITWDDWGGFYDHVVPPLADENGLRAAGALGSS